MTWNRRNTHPFPSSRVNKSGPRGPAYLVAFGSITALSTILPFSLHLIFPPSDTHHSGPAAILLKSELPVGMDHVLTHLVMSNLTSWWVWGELFKANLNQVWLSRTARHLRSGTSEADALNTGVYCRQENSLQNVKSVQLCIKTELISSIWQ